MRAPLSSLLILPVSQPCCCLPRGGAQGGKAVRDWGRAMFLFCLLETSSSSGSLLLSVKGWHPARVSEAALGNPPFQALAGHFLFFQIVFLNICFIFQGMTQNIAGHFREMPLVPHKASILPQPAPNMLSYTHLQGVCIPASLNPPVHPHLSLPGYQPASLTSSFSLPLPSLFPLWPNFSPPSTNNTLKGNLNPLKHL